MTDAGQEEEEEREGVYPTKETKEWNQNIAVYICAQRSACKQQYALTIFIEGVAYLIKRKITFKFPEVRSERRACSLNDVTVLAADQN